MGLIRKGAAALAVAGFLCTAGLNAAPRLRLLSSTVGPVSIAQGANGSAPPVEAYNVASRAPRLLVGLGLYGVITNLDGSRPMPDGSWPGVAAHPAKAGDTLTLWAIGLGSTSPFVATGQAAPSSEPLARLTTTPTINFGGGIGGAIAIPDFAGLSPGSAGLYQINVRIPDLAPKGAVYVTLAFGDSTSNPVQIVIQ